MEHHKKHPYDSLPIRSIIPVMVMRAVLTASAFYLLMRHSIRLGLFDLFRKTGISDFLFSRFGRHRRYFGKRCDLASNLLRETVRPLLIVSCRLPCCIGIDSMYQDYGRAFRIGIGNPQHPSDADCSGL